MCVAQLASVPCWPQQLVLTSNRIESAQLKHIKSGLVVFRTEQGELQVPLTEIVYWGSLCEPARREWLCLRNGSLVSGNWLGMENSQLIWHNDYLGDFQVAVSRVAGIVFQLPGLFPEKDLLFDKVLQGWATGFVLLANGDQLDARLLNREKNGDVIIATRFGEQTFSSGQIRAVSFPIGSSLESESITFAVGLKDGSRIMVTNLEARPAPSASIPSAAPSADQGEQDAVRRLIAEQCEYVCFLQNLAGVVYLSDLTPETFIAVPFLEYVRGYRRDRNVLGGWLRDKNGSYLKGLGTYSACRIRYALEGQFSQFAAEIAIDACAERKGSVICHVLVDGQRKATAGPIRGQDQSFPIVVDVSGATQLDLVVDFGEWADECDYTNWLNARLIPASRLHSEARGPN
ncbi:MAG: NPCBM/NEW2 domain-containing protein [Thermogutta sp.]